MKFFRKIKKKISAAIGDLKSRFDRLGSYTGRPNASDDSSPEQDADDL